MSSSKYAGLTTLTKVLDKCKSVFANVSHTHTISEITDINKIEDLAKTYSTEEQVVGTWIDGKDIYQRTFVYSADFSKNIDSNKTQEDGTPATNPKTNWIYYNFDEPFIDQYIKVEGVARCTSESTSKKVATSGEEDMGQWQPIPRVCPDACENYSIGFGDLIPEKMGILFGYLYYTAEIYLTFLYTKQ